MNELNVGGEANVKRKFNEFCQKRLKIVENKEVSFIAVIKRDGKWRSHSDHLSHAALIQAKFNKFIISRDIIYRNCMNNFGYIEIL